MITDNQLKQIVPASIFEDRNAFLVELNKLPARYGITSVVLPAFIAQVAHESANFHYLKEIASGKAYEGRKDLGNIHPGDGIKYKGRAYMQVTGLKNYQTFMAWLGGVPDIVSHPEMLERPHLAMLATVWFWTTHGCNDLALAGDFLGLSRKINLGRTNTTLMPNGYANRLAIYERAKTVLAA
jgi:putative chitinase